MNVSAVKLKDKNYAIIAPGQITYALDATREELEEVMKEVEKDTRNFKISNDDNTRVSLAIMPTYDCNLRCIYCYANGGAHKEVINFNTAKTAIDYVRNYNKYANTLDLYLVGGGEPLLHFDLVKRIVDYADEIFENVSINVVTNGTFSKEISDWLIQRKANVRISYDVVGQDIHRPYENGTKSKADVEKTIKTLINGKINVMIQCIITTHTINKMREIVDKLIGLNVSAVKIEPCLMTDISRGNINLQPNPVDFANKLLDVIEYVAINDLPILIDTGYFTKPTLGKYCGMGNGNFTVTPEGMVTSCVEVSRKNDPYADKIIFGEIGKKVKIDEDKVAFLDKVNYKNQIGGCCTCEYRLICLGGCPMANIWQNGLPLKKSNFTCTVEHTLLPKLLMKILDNQKIMNVIMENVVCE